MILIVHYRGCFNSINRCMRPGIITHIRDILAIAIIAALDSVLEELLQL